ncbi:MAG: hypothetical protein P8X79_16015 [Reinekea sp.]
MLPKNWGEPMAAPAIFQANFQINVTVFGGQWQLYHWHAIQMLNGVIFTAENLWLSQIEIIAIFGQPLFGTATDHIGQFAGKVENLLINIVIVFFSKHIAINLK